jgi:cytochrome c-type biogenesis protein CcmE
MSKRTRTLGLLGVIIICIGALVYLGIRGNITYYYSVSQAVKKADSQGTTRFRIAGAVMDGTVHASGDTTRFKITDGDKIVNVIHHGDPPQLFKDGAPVVCEGHWQSTALGKTFDSDRILIKHGSEYTPPTVKQSTSK